MPGLFLPVAGEQILWSHDYAHAADHPDWDALPAKLAAFSRPRLLPAKRADRAGGEN